MRGSCERAVTGVRRLLIVAALAPGAALAGPCQSAAQLIDGAQDAHRPLAGELQTARQALSLCDAFETELFLAHVQYARHRWNEAQAAFLAARAAAGGDWRKLEEVDLERTVLVADRGPPCRAVAAFDSVARELADHGQSLPDWFTRRRLTMEAKWTASGLSASQITCALEAHEAARLQEPRGSRLFCSEVSLDIPVYFALASSQLDAAAQRQVDALARALQPLLTPADRVRVDGHTDEQGSDAYNQPLSEQRAARVADALARQLHLASARLETVGHGKRDPKYTAHTQEADRLNRRVEITVVPPECGS